MTPWVSMPGVRACVRACVCVCVCVYRGPLRTYSSQHSSSSHSCVPGCGGGGGSCSRLERCLWTRAHGPFYLLPKLASPSGGPGPSAQGQCWDIVCDFWGQTSHRWILQTGLLSSHPSAWWPQPAWSAPVGTGGQDWVRQNANL